MQRLFRYLALVLALTAAAASGPETAYMPESLAADGWYAKFLKAMKEPSLFKPPEKSPEEQYRFLWLRSFHKGMAVRIERRATSFSMRVVRVSGPGGYEPGEIESDKSVSVSAAEWGRFQSLLKEAAFWEFPTDEKTDDIGLDGSQWILEGRLGDRYHVVDRWTPESGAEARNLTHYVQCCKYLLQLGKVEVPKDEFY